MTVSGLSVADARWLAERVRDLGAAWGCDARTAGTLWWYMGSSTLLREPVGALTHGSVAPDPTLERLRCTVRSDGGLDGVTFDSTVDGVESVGAALRETFGRLLPMLARVSGAGEPALWSLAADALGNCALGATDAADARKLADELAFAIGPALPTPRFVEVNGRAFVRRGSCCLIYETGRAGKCVSCPRHTPDERAGLLNALTRPGR